MSEKKGSFKTAGQNLKEGLKKGWDQYKSGDISYTIPSLAKKLWGKKAQQNRETVRAKMGLNPEPPLKKPTLVSSKFKKTPSGEQAKIPTSARLKEIEREDALKNIEKVVKGKKYGGRVKLYGMKRGGSPVCRGMGAATRGGKYKAT